MKGVAVAGSPRNLRLRGVALGAFRIYWRAVSPGLLPACRFLPTCSHYSYEAIARHGLAKGGMLTAWRLLRCNPFNDGGYDPVP